MDALLPYFAYGSNLNRADMRVRCPGAQPSVVARLEDWRLTFRGVADIEPVEGYAAHGALWLCGSEDVCSLDRYEGAPAYYRRRIVTVQTAEGPRDAMTYVMAGEPYLGLPSDWYFGRIEEGYRDWGLPLDELRQALQRTRELLASRGIDRFRPDGRKRLRAVEPRC